jgi:hypothetical protein
MPEPTLNQDKFELLKLVSDLSEKESDRTWKRYNTMLTANTFLLSAITLFGKELDPILKVVLGLLGIFIASIWIKISLLSKKYEKRWHNDMDELIANDNYFKAHIKGRQDKTLLNSEQKSKPTATRKSSSYFSRLVSWGFILVWMSILSMLL